MRWSLHLASITLRRDQVAVGFIMTLLAIDLSSFAGVNFVRKPGPSVGHLPIPALADIPVVGPILFSQDAVTYLSFLLIIGMAVFLRAPSRACGCAALASGHRQLLPAAPM